MNDVKLERRSRENGRRTRQRLLASAVALWSEYGQLGVTVSAVAKHANTTRRTVYHHFPTLEKLLEEAELYVETELAALAGGDSSLLFDPYRLVAGLAADNPELIRSVLFKILRDDPSENPIVAGSVQFWLEFGKERGLKDGVKPSHAAAIAIAMWLAAILVVPAKPGKAERRREVEDFAEVFERLLIEGILTKAPTTPR